MGCTAVSLVGVPPSNVAASTTYTDLIVREEEPAEYFARERPYP